MDSTLKSPLTGPERQKEEKTEGRKDRKTERQKDRSYQDYTSGLWDSARKGTLSFVVQGLSQKGPQGRGWLSGFWVPLRVLSWVWLGGIG